MCVSSCLFHWSLGRLTGVQHGNAQFVTRILAHKPNLNVADKLEKRTPLIVAARVRSHSLFFCHGALTQRAQNGHTAVVSLLLQAGADVALDSAVGTARDAAHSSGKQAVVDVIDAHLCQQLRHQLADLCCALASTTLPVLLLLECFAWTSSTTYASRFVQLPLDEQWRIAKHVREAASTQKTQAPRN